MGKCRHYYHHWTHNSYNNVGNKKLLLLVEPQLRSTIRSRGIGTLVYRFLKGALKLRYLLLGGAVGGGMSLHKVIGTFICQK